MQQNLLLIVVIFACLVAASFLRADNSMSDNIKISPAALLQSAEPIATMPSNEFEPFPECGVCASTAINLGDGVAIEFALVSSGSFVMASPDNETGAYCSENPQYLVNLSTGFYMGISEVTQEQFEKIMGYNPSYFKHSTSCQHPVEHVSWFDAVRFCNALSRRSGLTPCYTNQNGDTVIADTDTVSCSWTANGYRLPTEAEWEYACRAGTTTSYQSGDVFDQAYGWCWENSFVDFLPNSRGRGTHAVAQKTGNAWGLFDMHGNLWEWCWDCYATRQPAHKCEHDPHGPASGTCRVYRGGCWSSRAAVLRSTVRNGCYPLYRNGHLGFRLLRIVP